MEKSVSQFQRVFQSLQFRMNGGGPHLLEGTPLYDEAVKLLFDAVVAGPAEKEMVSSSYYLLNRFKPITPTLPEDVDLNKMVTITGNVSQFTGEAENSSCTSCAMAFLRYVLPKGVAWDLRGTQVTNYVGIGKALHNHLRESIEKQKQLMTEEDRRSLGESFIHYQAFSSHDIADYYSLNVIRALPARHLPTDTLNFFRRELDSLQQCLSETRSKVGVTIHCRDYTYALIIFDTIKGREFVFFDSHGKAELNDGNPNAYVKYTFNPEEMARFLATLLPFQPIEGMDESFAMDLARQGGTEEILGEANKYICYLMELREGEPVVEEDFVHIEPSEETPGNPLAGPAESIPSHQTVPSGVLGQSSFVDLGGSEEGKGGPPPTDPHQASQSSSPTPSSSQSDGGSGPEGSSRINLFVMGLFALVAAAGLYRYRKPLENMITSFTSALGIIQVKK